MSAAPDLRSANEIAAAEPFKGRWYALGLLTAIHATHHIDRNVVSVVVEPIKEEFGLSDAAMGLVAGIAHSGTLALFVLPLSYLADRVNRAKFLAIVAAIWSALTALTALAGNFTSLLLLRAGVGAAEAGGPPAMVSMIADYFPERSRPTAMGIYYLSIALGTGGIFALGGWIAHLFGWRAVFLIAGIPGVMLSLLVRFTLREPPRSTPPAPVDRRAVSGQAREIAGNRTLLFIIVGGTLATAAQTSLWAWMASFLMRFHALDVAEAGLVVAAAILFGKAAGSLCSGPLTSLLSRHHPHLYWRHPALMLVIAMPLGWWMVTTPSLTVATGTAIMIGFAFGSWAAPAMTIVLAGAPEALRATSVGAYILSANLLGIGLGPLTTGLLSDAFGHGGLAPAIAWTLTINVPAAIAIYLSCRFLPRDAAAAGAP